MRNCIWGLLAGVIAPALIGVSVASAACTVPNTLTNGQTTDATQVMANFNAVAGCFNAAPAGSTNAIQIKQGTGVFAGVGPLTNGQLVIGSTGSAPVAATLTPGAGVTITNSAGAITIAAPGTITTGAPLSTILTATSGQSIANNAWTAVTWDSTAVRDDVGAFSSSAPTILTVPGGFTRARITVHTIWPNNSSGLRLVQVDGSGFPQAVGVAEKNAAVESGDYVVTQWLQGLTSGSQFSVVVLQSSGGTLAFSPPGGFGQASFQIEWAP